MGSEAQEGHDRERVVSFLLYEPTKGVCGRVRSKSNVLSTDIYDFSNIIGGIHAKGQIIYDFSHIFFTLASPGNFLYDFSYIIPSIETETVLKPNPDFG